MCAADDQARKRAHEHSTLITRCGNRNRFAGVIRRAILKSNRNRSSSTGCGCSSAVSSQYAQAA